MFENLKPLADRVLIKCMESEEKTSGGLYIPESAQEKAQVGEIKAVGPGRLDSEGKRIPMNLKIGEKVYFDKYAGTDTGKGYIIVREEEVLGSF